MVYYKTLDEGAEEIIKDAKNLKNRKEENAKKRSDREAKWREGGDKFGIGFLTKSVAKVVNFGNIILKAPGEWQEGTKNRQKAYKELMLEYKNYTTAHAKAKKVRKNYSPLSSPSHSIAGLKRRGQEQEVINKAKAEENKYKDKVLKLIESISRMYPKNSINLEAQSLKNKIEEGELKGATVVKSMSDIEGTYAARKAASRGQASSGGFGNNESRGGQSSRPTRTAPPIPGRNSEETSPKMRMSTNSEETSPKMRMSTHSEETSPKRRMSTNSEETSPKMRMSTHSEETSPKMRMETSSHAYTRRSSSDAGYESGEASPKRPTRRPDHTPQVKPSEGRSNSRD